MQHGATTAHVLFLFPRQFLPALCSVDAAPSLYAHLAVVPCRQYKSEEAVKTSVRARLGTGTVLGHFDRLCEKCPTIANCDTGRVTCTPPTHTHTRKQNLCRACTASCIGY